MAGGFANTLEEVNAKVTNNSCKNFIVIFYSKLKNKKNYKRIFGHC
jgi:hypothetical protein